jgi:hypothetical protein
MERAYLITELTDLKIDFSNYDRLELGDPTCEWSFLKLLKEKTWLQRLTLLRKPLSIVFPPLSEGSFAKAMPLISKYREINGSIEWVVNDFGTLQSVSEIRQGHDRVVFGNFLVNQSKDPALALFSGAKNHRTLPVDNTFYAEYFRHW